MANLQSELHGNLQDESVRDGRRYTPLHQPPLPATMQAGAHDIVEQIVPPRNGAEQLAHFFGAMLIRLVESAFHGRKRNK